MSSSATDDPLVATHALDDRAESSSRLDSRPDPSSSPPTAATSGPRSSRREDSDESSGSEVLESAIDLVRDDLAAVEDRLAELLESTLAIIPRVGGHLAFAGGKRFRPIVALLAAKASGVPTNTAITVAAVGELLHTATLLHDDVIDGADYRRGRPAARYRYGNGVAVLTGDYCLARALQAMAATGRLEAVESMADTVTRMAEGEVAQLQVAGDWSMDRDRYYMVIDRKTAALIAWCSSVAGLVDKNERDALARYGLELGYAFQISDDIIDYGHGLEHTGKSRGQDLSEGKMTLPLLLACDELPDLRPRLAKLLRGGPPFPTDALQEIVERVCGCGALEATRNLANEHARSAAASLSSLPKTPARSALEAIADSVSGRSK